MRRIGAAACAAIVALAMFVFATPAQAASSGLQFSLTCHSCGTGDVPISNSTSADVTVQFDVLMWTNEYAYDQTASVVVPAGGSTNFHWTVPATYKGLPALFTEITGYVPSSGMNEFFQSVAYTSDQVTVAISPVVNCDIHGYVGYTNGTADTSEVYYVLQGNGGTAAATESSLPRTFTRAAYGDFGYQSQYGNGFIEYEYQPRTGDTAFTVTVKRKADDAVLATSKPLAINCVLSKPRLTGYVRVGSKVICSAKIGFASPAQEIMYSWYVGSTWVGSGLYSRSYYVPSYKDLGKPLRCTITIWGDAHGLGGSSATKIGYGVFIVSRAPAITGMAKVGKVLKANVGIWHPAGTYHYQWFRGTSKIAGATKASYKLTKADRYKYVKVRITVSKTAYVTKAAYSKALRIRA